MSRFAVEWLVPGQPDRLTHVMLLDRERPAPYVVAVGYGSDTGARAAQAMGDAQRE